MSSTASSRIFVSLLALASFGSLAGCTLGTGAGQLIHRDDFSDGLGQWHIEAEKPAAVTTGNGVLDIDSPAGITLWFKPKLTGPVRIEFEAIAVSEGGANDQVSDLNVFWMASNADGTEPVFARARSGSFAEYNDLLTYYVGLGGNRNSTSRFRRYVGDPVNRPLLPEHDLTRPDALLVPNKKQKITLTANRHTIDYKRDGQALFQLSDQRAYEAGWFAIRSTWSHLRIDNLRVYAIDARNSATN
jgi:hypothetical protein